MEKPQLPQNIEAEEAVLGSILIDPDAIIPVSGVLKPEMFFSAVNRVIFERMLAIHGRGAPIDLVTLTDEMDKNGDKSQASYLTSLISATPTSVHAEYYARAVQRTAILRALIDTAGKITKMAFSPDGDEAEDVLGKSERLISNIWFGATNSAPALVGETANRIIDVYQAQANGLKPDFIKTGFANLDNILKHVGRHRLMMCAGRPGTGKSATSLHVAYNLAAKGKPVMFYSMEMDSVELVNRMVGINTGIDTQKLEEYDLLSPEEAPAVFTALGEIDKMPMFIREGSMNVSELEADIARSNMICLQRFKHPLAMVFIDQLNKIARTPGSKATNRNLELEEITTRLKMMCMPNRLHTPIWLNHQLNREVEKRGGNGRPILSDLRDSGAAEQDADIVIFVYPECNYLPENERNAKLKSFEGGWEPYTLIVGKNRSGPTGDAAMAWCRSTGQIRSILSKNGGKK